MALRPDWRRQLRPSALKPKDFTRVMQRAITERISGAKVRSPGELELVVKLPDESELQIWLGNLFGNLTEDHQERLDAVEHFIAALAATPAVDELPPPTVESIIPQIKDDRFIEHISSLGDGSEAPLLIESLVADLHVLYASDSEYAIRPLREDDLPELGISGADLRSIAVENLRRILPPIEAQQNEYGGMMTCGGTYEASILLLDKVWDQVQEHYSGPVVACVPARDMMLFGNSIIPEALDMIRDIADEIEESGSYLISRTILIRQDGQWHEFERRD
jgi:uncharacterized protein YtpQ (UPF0354 family)